MAREIAGTDETRDFDFIVRGEGEAPMRELVDAIGAGGGYENVKNLSYRSDGGWRHNPKRELRGLEDIRLPGRSRRLWTGGGHRWFRSIEVIETSRGCTLGCKFCSIRRMYGATYRAYPIERVVADIADAKAHGYRVIAVSDDNITLDVDRLMALCDAIVEAGHQDLVYVVQASCAGIAASPEVARKMARAGFRVVFLGIENVRRRNLATMSKGNSPALTARAVRYLKDAGILIFSGVIVGFPDDTEADIAANYKFIHHFGTDFVLDQIITPYPGTETRREMLAEGLVTNALDFRWYNGYWANVRTHRFSAAQVQFLRYKYHAMYAPYLSPSESLKRFKPFAYYLKRSLQVPYERTRRCRMKANHTDEWLFQRKMNRELRRNLFPELMEPDELGPAVPGGVSAARLSRNSPEIEVREPIAAATARHDALH
jgi:radical SAM superfamily enzyme YgiQ (UPF0313 family)